MLPKGEIEDYTEPTRPPVKGLLTLAPVLMVILLAAQAAVPGEQGPTITYTISLAEDGSAIWNMEYRTPLLSDGDMASFQNYSSQIQGTYLPEYSDLMKRSAAEASIATGRPVTVGNLTADAAVQSAPTGSYGVVQYRCRWEGFASGGDPLTVGDVFVGGLYLGKDHALIIRPPSGYGVSDASPSPDRTQDGLTWYGLRSFGAGEPRVVLRKDTIPWIPVIILLFAVFLGAGVYGFRRLSHPAPPGPDAPQEREVPDPRTAQELEERILSLLGERGGSLFQSEIVELLGLPKSTVSEAINRLHAAGRIMKVRKGRENKIVLV